MVLSKLRGMFAEDGSAEESGADRRRHRRQSVLLKATLYPIDVYCDVIIHNASRSGLMGEADVELSIGQVLHLSLDELTYHTGKVRWTRGRRFGLELDNALVILSLSDEMEGGEEEGQRARLRRSTMRLPARLSTGRPSRPATVRNISRSGMQLDTSDGLQMGQHVLVKLANRPLIAGRVQWSRGGRVGIRTAALMSTLQLVYSAD